MKNFAFNNPTTSGMESVIGYINFNAGTSALDLNECITYVSQSLSTLFTITEVTPQARVQSSFYGVTSYFQQEVFLPIMY